MSVLYEFYDFVIYILLGIIISCIFDIFKALRRVHKKTPIYVVAIQDIIFFAIVTLITTLYMIYRIDDKIRAYMFIAMTIGIVLSQKTISKVLVRIYKMFFITLESTVNFLCVPIVLWYSVFCKIMKKIIKKCCNLFSHMINLKYGLLSVFNKMNNFRIRRLNNGKKTRDERKNKSKKEKKVS